jgi:peptide/nickel transport system ATP-binding protein
MMLFVKDLSIHGPSGPIVKNISFKIKKGQCLALVGESGSGKSMIALTMMGLLPPQLNASDYSESKKVKAIMKAMIFQEPMSSLNPTMRVGEQIMEGAMTSLRLTKPQAKKEAIMWIDKVKIKNAETAFLKYPHQLSGGERQRVMIAMAMIMQPELLIADEPTTALDQRVADDILSLIQDLQMEKQISLLFISHDIDVVKRISNDIMVIHKGREVESGKTSEVLLSPQMAYTKGLLAARPPKNKKPYRLSTIDDFMDNKGRRKSEKLQTSIGSVILEVKNLEKYYSKKLILNNISLELREGETLGLVGPSGSGKSTLGKCIVNLEPVSGGEIKYRGRRIEKMNSIEKKRLAKEIQYIFQDPFSSLSPKMTIEEILYEPMEAHGLHKNKSERHKKITELLSSVGIENDSCRKYPHQFSGGQRQRIGIARALALGPKVLICDESVAALDLSVQAKVLNLLNDLKEKYGFSYIFISHDERVVNYMSNRIITLQ